MVKKVKQWGSIWLAALLLGACLAGCSSSAPASAQQAFSAAVISQSNQQPTAPVETGQAQKNQEYLEHYFKIKVGQQWDGKTFADALAAITGETAEPFTGEFSGLSAIEMAVAAAGYQELADSYPENKIKSRLLAYGIQSVPTEGAALACALDTSLINTELANLAMAEKTLPEAEVASLLMAVASATGKGRNYLAYSNDAEIHARLDATWNSFVMFGDDTLNEIGKTVVENEIATGYNLKDGAFDARFLPGYTLQYGHDNIKHAHQLMGLLNSEGIVARIQLEPKISVYRYLLEWGPVPDSTPTYEVRQFSNNLHLVFSVEYDLQLEFETEQDMMAFDWVINEYAKKNEGNEEAVGLIVGAWWQPLYTTTREDMPAEDYRLIYDCVVQNGDYSIHPFCMPEKLDKTVEALKELGAGENLTPVARYCNTAFYNYLSGDDFQ